MRRPLGGIRLSKLSIGLLVFGAALLLVAFWGRWVTIGSNQIFRGAPWWVPVVLGTVGLLAVVLAVAASWELGRKLWTGGGFFGALAGRCRLRGGWLSGRTCRRRLWRDCGRGEDQWR